MSYYRAKLAGQRLQQCYASAPPRIQQYLEAEIEFILARVNPDTVVLELGCGYGRVISRVAAVAKRVVGIDTARASLELARTLGGPQSKCEYLEMDATRLNFAAGSFDLVFCIQNGICAFGVDQMLLVKEAVRVCRPGGALIFSSYSEKIWPDRLQWFELQAAQGLVGTIDYEHTGNGVIVCRDGFRADALDQEGFMKLCSDLGYSAVVTEVDEASIMCEIKVAR